jgi:hypothetical protein
MGWALRLCVWSCLPVRSVDHSVAPSPVGALRNAQPLPRSPATAYYTNLHSPFFGNVLLGDAQNPLCTNKKAIPSRSPRSKLYYKKQKDNFCCNNCCNSVNFGELGSPIYRCNFRLQFLLRSRKFSRSTCQNLAVRSPRYGLTVGGNAQAGDIVACAAVGFEPVHPVIFGHIHSVICGRVPH